MVGLQSHCSPEVLSPWKSFASPGQLMPAPVLGARMGLPGPVKRAGIDKPGMVLTTGDEELLDELWAAPTCPCTGAGLFYKGKFSPVAVLACHSY